MKFAKLIELPDDEQFLIVVNYDECDDNLYQLELTMYHEGMRLKTTLGGIESQHDAIKAMEDFDQKKACSFVDSMLSSLTD